MKKLLTILGIAILVFSVNAQNSIVLNSNTKGISKTDDHFSGFKTVFSFDEIKITTITDSEKGNFSMLSIAEAFPDGVVGEPALPIFKKMMAVPDGATPKVVVRNYTTTEYDLSDYDISSIIPVQPPVLQGEETEQKPLIVNESVYAANEYTASSMASVKVLGTMRGVRIGMLDVRPVRYNPVANSLIVYNDIEVEVIFENADYAATQTLYQATFSPYFKDIYDVLFNRNVYDDHPDLYQTPVHMLVIAGRMFEQTLKPLLDWKTQKGFYLDVNYTDEIGTSAEAIKNLCQQKYNTGVSNNAVPTFVLLVGDVEQIPASATGSATGHVTDLYYGSVDGDYFPDMYYSRLSAQTPQQLKDIIDKILYYEKFLFKKSGWAEPGYFLTNEVLIAGIDGIWNTIMGRQQIHYAMDHFHDMSIIDDFSEPPYFYWWQYLSNVGFLNYAGFCTETQWNYPEFTTSDVYEMIPKDECLQVVLANCNLSSDFSHDECVGEAFIRVPDRGAVGYVGSSAPTFWNENFHFAVGAYATLGDQQIPTPENTTMGYYDAMYRATDFNCIGSQVFFGNLAVTYAVENDYPLNAPSGNSALYYWQAYHVLGDASIMPFWGMPENNQVSFASKLLMGESHFEVKALPGSYVAISKEGVLHGTAVANADGVASVPINPPITTGGKTTVTVTLNQHKPYTGQTQAVSAIGPYIILNNFRVSGIGNLTYATDNADVFITLQNFGNEPLTAPLDVTISCDDPQLTINKATAQYPAMEVDEKKSGTFKMSVAHDIEDGHIFTINLVAVNADGRWELSFDMPAYTAVLSLEKIFVNNVKNGILEAGTTAVIVASIKNEGGARAYNIKGSIAADDPYITVFCSDAIQSVGNIEAGESKNITFVVSTAASMPDDYLSELSLSVIGHYDLTYNTLFNVGTTEYSIPEPTSCEGNDQFKYVKLEAIENNDERCNPDGYSDFTTMKATLLQGKSYPIEFKCMYEDNYVTGWIDWNGNNVFDEDEIVVGPMVCPPWGGMSGFNVKAPADAVPGTHRLRMRVRYGRYPLGPYDGWDKGQTHDYSIEIPEQYSRAKNVNAVLTENNVVITWESPSNMTPSSYIIYKNGTKISTVKPPEYSYEDIYLASGLYVYSVEASYGNNKNALAAMANPVCLSGYDFHCNPPVQVAATVNPGETTVTITWNEPEDIDDIIRGYNVYRNDVKINNYLISDHEYKNTGLSNGEYSYYVTAVYKNCEESMPSEVVEVEINVGINEVHSPDFRLYPNPANNQITIKGEGLNRVEIFDLQGRRLAEYSNFRDEIQITGLERYATGIYLVRIHCKNGLPVTKRLAVIR